MNLQMRVEGGAQIARALQQLSQRASNTVLRGALQTVAAPPIQAGMAARAPRNPGAPDLSEHIAIEPLRNQGRTAAVAVGPSREARSDQPDRTFAQVGLFNEFGTVDTPMQPFARPTFDQDAPKVIAPMGAALWAAVIGRGLAGTRGTSSGGGLA